MLLFKGYESPCGVMRERIQALEAELELLRIPMRGYERSWVTILVIVAVLRIPMRGYEASKFFNN